MAVFTTSIGLAAAGAMAAPTASAAPAAGDGAGAAVAVFVARGHAVTIDQTLRPGMHKFVVRSLDDASFQLARPAPGYTKAEAARDINLGLNMGRIRALKRFERNIDLVGGVSSTADQAGVMWARLSAGTYWAVDTNTRTTRVRHLRTVQVAGPRVAGQAHPTAVIRAINETDWAPRPRQISHRGRLEFRNNSADNHFIILARLADGKTMADFKAWIDGGAQTPPPIDERAAGLDTGVVSPGMRMTLRYNLPRGRYVMLCFWPDADMGGMPHVFMGMYR
ncbi:MAG TPA: hypothetical protein VFG63_14500, partial [Nocardioidaceae bacterium]|nr:hypothetical protein [Nocardioidaceae bacterium]